MQDMPGAYLVPFTVDAQQGQGASQANESALVVMSRDEIQGLQKDNSLSALIQGVNVYLPAVPKASSAGLFANPLAQLNKELANLGITDRSQSIKIGNRVVAIASNVDQKTGLMNVTVSIPSTLGLYTPDLVVNIADKATGDQYTQALDIKGVTTFERLPVSEYGITLMRLKASSAGLGHLIASTDYLRFYADDDVAATLSQIADSPVMKMIQDAAERQTNQPSGDFGKVYNELVKNISSDSSAIPIQDLSGLKAFIVSVEGHVLMVVNTYEGVKYGVVVRVEPTKKYVEAAMRGERIEEVDVLDELIDVENLTKLIPQGTDLAGIADIASMPFAPKTFAAETNPADLLATQLTNAQIDLLYAQKELAQARLVQDHENQSLAEAIRAGVEDSIELVKADVERANASLMQAENALTVAERRLAIVQDAAVRLDSGKASSAGIVIVNDLFPGLSSLSEDTAAKLLLRYPAVGIAVSNIDVAEEKQAIIVYSDALKESPALQNIIKEAASDRRRFYLVNKEQETTEEFLTGLGIDKSVFEAHVFNKGSLSAEQLALAIGAHIRAQKFGPSKFFISAEEDSMALERIREKGLEFLVMILKDKRFEIITDYTEQHAEYIRAHLQALIAA